MASLCINVDFITGRCVAADVSNREQPEWPPHPGRVFMALAAACFEMDEQPDEVAALQWLESLDGAPEVVCSKAETRTPVSVYVPVNDKIAPSKSLLQATPGLSRSKQERAFPVSVPHSTVVTYRWNNVKDASEHIGAIQQICSNVIRVGHSSSLVYVTADLPTTDRNEERNAELDRMDSIATSPEYGTTNSASEHVWVPVSGSSRVQMRIVGRGEFERLKIACGAERIDRFAALSQIIQSTKGTSQKEAKKTFEQEYGVSFKKSLRPPAPTPPVLGLWQGYVTAKELNDVPTTVFGKHFDSELIVLHKIEGPNLGVQDTLALTAALRNCAMKASEIQPVPEWLSGHVESNSKPSTQPHVAFLTLPFVGSKHADGHIMGLAMALPNRNLIPPEKWGPVFRQLLFDDSDNARTIQLRLGRLGEWTARMEDDDGGRTTLKNATWTGPSEAWASATPVVLDRFPKTSRADDPNGWRKEVAQTIVRSCLLAGLPEPISVDVDTTSWLVGVPRAVPKRRRIRAGSSGRRQSTTAPLGDGFPSIGSTSNKPPRPQVHVHLVFDRPLIGPVIIGAGRFRGYGLCRPLAMKGGPR